MSQLDKFSGMKAISQAAVAEKAKTDRLLPTEQAAIEAFGEKRIERKYRKDGNYSWRVRIKPNDGHGKMSRDGQAIWGKNGLMIPYAKASAARVADQRGDPGDYGKGLKGKVALLAQSIQDQFCPRCEMRWSWCECARVADAGGARLTHGMEATREGG